jgi:hypothetical protein
VTPLAQEFELEDLNPGGEIVVEKDVELDR